MVKVIASSLRKGNVVDKDGKLYVILFAENIHPGKGTPVTQLDMLPLYRNGDVLIVEPGAITRKGDRVVVKTTSGEVMAKVLERQTVKSIALVSLNPDHPDRDIPMREVEWVARIVWASQ